MTTMWSESRATAGRAHSAVGCIAAAVRRLVGDDDAAERSLRRLTFASQSVVTILPSRAEPSRAEPSHESVRVAPPSVSFIPA